MATAQVMRMLRENPDGTDVRVYATNVDPDAPALRAADVGGVEPRYVGDAVYGEFALDFCRRHGVDVLIPPRRLSALAGLADAFAAVGTALMCSPPAAVEVLTSKVRTYEAAETAGVPVPPWRRVAGSAGFRTAVEELGADGERLCFKPAGEFSAFGFRVLDDAPLTLRDLLAAPEPVVSTAAVVDALRRAEDQGRAVPEFLVMPYLDGPEVSVDCLSRPGGSLLVGVARAKHGRYRHLLDDPAPVAVARRLVGHFGLAYLTNVQLRYRAGEPVLLEANPRPSAGIFQTAFTGLNLPWAAVRLLLDGDTGPLPAPRLGGRVAVTDVAVDADGADAATVRTDPEGPIAEPVPVEPSLPGGPAAPAAVPAALPAAVPAAVQVALTDALPAVPVPARAPRTEPAAPRYEPAARFGQPPRYEEVAQGGGAPAVNTVAPPWHPTAPALLAED
ncbi:ATP-grasp domain-containing protein [Actinacidiphila yeochonensis]|uniref:ATP-grasp domain-containing protein n=1 Tax=Actinacidiphila yeochonensis TaxID=89050 RepID=UPI0007C656CF|nr:ATP-grasp domain-containing protein [Actinacidiphila yeochonensis]